MRKAWLIAKSSYKRQIKSGSFLILTFAVPLLMVLVGAIPFILSADADLRSIGLSLIHI
jgi:ABC-type Na+ efflux pump permease subunit